MKTALIAGATGMVGQMLLNTILESEHYQNVIAIVRHPLKSNHPKLINQVIDFEQLPEFTTEQHVDDVFCCLGTTIKKAGSQEAFTKVDYTYVVNLATWTQNNHCQQFAVISSVGATSETSNFYLRTKGNMESSISHLTIPAIHIFRPSLLLGQRNEFRLGEKMADITMRFFNPLMKGRLRKYKAIEADKVAQAMHNKAQSGQNGLLIYEGADIK